MDMGKTKAAIVDLSSKPCSVIIIGVGQADFSSMEELDGDGALLKDEAGRTCARDIVQFVGYKEAMVRGDLAAQVLKEVPPQVCSYMQMVDFRPKAVVQDMSQFVAVVPNQQ